MATSKKAAASRISSNGEGIIEPVPQFEIAEPSISTMQVCIIGVTPLIVHAWSQKAKQMMLDAQTKGKARVKVREPKNPHEDFVSSLYVSDAGWTGVPAAGFKAALVGTCRTIDGLPMTLAKRILFVERDGYSSRQGRDLVRIYGKYRMREDMVRLETGTADIRFRAEYPDWRAILTITFNSAVLQPNQVQNLLEMAGTSEGTCEWRPSSPKSSTGTYGRWRVATDVDTSNIAAFVKGLEKEGYFEEEVK